MTPEQIAGAREALQQYGHDTDDADWSGAMAVYLESALAEIERIRPVYEAAKAWKESDCSRDCPLRAEGPHAHHCPERIAVMKLAGAVESALASEAPRVDDETRCAVCQWPLAETAEKGCVRGNCSMRPPLANYYAPERAAREQADMIRGVPVEQRGKEQS